MLDAAAEDALRRCAREAFGAEPLALEPIAAELSLRRFLRLRLPGRPASAVARFEAPEDPAGRPPGIAPEPPLAPVLGLFAAGGLPVPRRYGGDPERGIDLLEDLGDTSLESEVSRAPESRRSLYAEAVSLVPRVQRLRDPGGHPSFRRRLDPATLAYKAALFLEHSVPRALGRPAGPAEDQLVRDAFHHVADSVAAAPARLAHRDLQSRNLHVAQGTPRLRLLDVQGAFLAPPEYDLVCLLRDSYVELPDAEVRAHLAGVRAELPDAPSAEESALRFDLLTLARKGKDHARFVYAAEQRGDERYLQALPATTRALHAAAGRIAAALPPLRPFAELLLALPENACAR